jgi:hypothetical protein
MVKKQIAIICCVLVGAFYSNAQIITLKGSVKDSLQNPLSYANVIAKPADLTKNLQFAITDDAGLYKLELTKNDTYTISVSYMGFKTANFELIASENALKNIVL